MAAAPVTPLVSPPAPSRATHPLTDKLAEALERPVSPSRAKALEELLEGKCVATWASMKPPPTMGSLQKDYMRLKKDWLRAIAIMKSSHIPAAVMSKLRDLKCGELAEHLSKVPMMVPPEADLRRILPLVKKPRGYRKFNNRPATAASATTPVALTAEEISSGDDGDDLSDDELDSADDWATASAKSKHVRRMVTFTPDTGLPPSPTFTFTPPTAASSTAAARVDALEAATSTPGVAPTPYSIGNFSLNPAIWGTPPPPPSFYGPPPAAPPMATAMAGGLPPMAGNINIGDIYRSNFLNTLATPTAAAPPQSIPYSVPLTDFKRLADQVAEISRIIKSPVPSAPKRHREEKCLNDNKCNQVAMCVNCKASGAILQDSRAPATRSTTGMNHSDYFAAATAAISEPPIVSSPVSSAPIVAAASAYSTIPVTRTIIMPPFSFGLAFPSRATAKNAEQRVEDVDKLLCTELSIWHTHSSALAFHGMPPSEEECRTLNIDGQHLTVAAKEQRLTVRTMDQWALCFSTYAAHLLQRHPHLGPSVATYMAAVFRWFYVERVPLDTVLMLDKHHRTRFADGSLAWGTEDHFFIFMNRMITPGGSLPETTTRKAPRAAAPRSPAVKRPTRSACYRYNGMVPGTACTNGSACKYRHECVVCGGAHSAATEASCKAKADKMPSPPCTTTRIVKKQ